MFKRRIVSSSRSAAGFTLIELLVVVAIIALLISILLPSLQRAREISRRTACCANLGGFGRGALTYAEVNRGVLPSSDHDPSKTNTVPQDGQTPQSSATLVGKRMYLKDRQSAMGATPGTADNDASNTRGWFKLLQGGTRAYVKGKQLICQSTKMLRHSPDGARGQIMSTEGNEAPAYDFNGALTEEGQATSAKLYKPGDPAPTEMSEFSYSWQVTIRNTGPDGQIWGHILQNTQDPGKAIAADRNPYSNFVGAVMPHKPFTFGGASFSNFGGFGRYDYEPDKEAQNALGFSPPPRAGGTPQDYVNALRREKSANSRNHKQSGQNICYLDGHAKWSNNPKAGVDDDSIWSNWVLSSGSTPDFAVCDTNMPCDAEPPASKEYGKMRARSTWQTDSVLIP